MEDKNQLNFSEAVKLIYKNLIVIFVFVMLFTGVLFYMIIDPGFSAFQEKSTTTEYVIVDEDEESDKIVDGIHERTGLIDGVGLMETVNNCTNCHSAKLITQNRMNKEAWAATIDWMQETQNLWGLGKNEEIIINYLVTNYPVQKKGRRQALIDIQWYDLKD